MSRYRGLGRLSFGVAAMVLCGVCAAAQAAVVAQYNFEGSNVAASAKDANVTASSFQLGPTLTNPDWDIGYSGGVTGGTCRKADTWPTNGLDTDKWYGFTVTLDAGYKLDASSVTFDAFRKQIGPPTQLQVRCSIDGGAFQDYGPVQATGPTNVWTSFDIQSSLLGITNSIVVRIYGYYASVASRSLRIDNVTLNGTMTLTGVARPVISQVSMSDLYAGMVGFNSSTAATYTVQYRDDLLGGNWADIPALTGVPGTGSLLVLTDASSASVPIRFYRVKGASLP